jgi:phospholipase/carboxylesterase
MTTNLLPRIEMETAPHPTGAVILLHGLGADGNDFASLAPELNLDGCDGIRFVFPHAPSLPVTINGGYAMPAWYDITGTDRVSKQDAAGIQKSALAVQALIENEIARGIPAHRIVLSGFSQGSAMSLHTGLRLPYALAGVMALSGYLPLADRFAAERSEANAKTPIFLAHGTRDPVVVPRRGEETRDALLALGYDVQWHTYDMPHSVNLDEIADMGTFLRTVLPALK